MGDFAYPPIGYIPAIVLRVARLPQHTCLPFLRVFLDDVCSSQVEGTGRGGEPVMSKDFLDSGERDPLLSRQGCKRVP